MTAERHGDALARLNAVLGRFDRAAVAVSGGVDSMTLAHVARHVLGDGFTAFHATSPAVPAEATARVRRHAARHGWRLEVVTAGEFDDPDYLRNPYNRCYFCKTNLYDCVARHTADPVFSGANTDDLGDFRPGLAAAAEHGVVHPYVEAGIDKAAVRAIARHLGLADVAELPAQPCLSSRIETGIAVRADHLAFVHKVEGLLQRALAPDTVRCRVTHDGVRVELDAAALARISAFEASLRGEIAAWAADLDKPFLGFEPYRRGSAFVAEREYAE
jgi:uncharacterized protein